MIELFAPRLSSRQVIELTIEAAALMFLCDALGLEVFKFAWSALRLDIYPALVYAGAIVGILMFSLSGLVDLTLRERFGIALCAAIPSIAKCVIVATHMPGGVFILGSIAGTLWILGHSR